MSLPPLNYTPSTELDSVNNLLMSIGQSPVNSLDVPGVRDVSIARITLHQVSREVQQRGWWFNVDTKWPLMPDIEGEVKLPANALQVIPPTGSTLITERAGKLYNQTDRTFVFAVGQPVEVDVKWFLAFEDMPQVARNYIERRAGRVFQANIIGSQILYQFTKELETEALAEMQRNQLRVSRPNILNSGASTNTINSRR